MASLQEFMKLSELLAGLDNLDPAVGDDYRRRLEATPGLILEDLVASFRKARLQPKPLAVLESEFGGDPKGQSLRRTAQQVVRIWYLSEYLDGTGGLSSANHFLDSALYRVIEAHPPAFSDRPHGYWVTSPHRKE